MTQGAAFSVTSLPILLLSFLVGCIQYDHARPVLNRPRAIRWVLVERPADEVSQENARPSQHSDSRKHILVIEPIWLIQEDPSIVIQVTLVSALPDRTPFSGEIVRVRIRIREPVPSAMYRVTALPDSSQVTLLTPMPQTVSGAEELEIRFTRRNPGRGGISIEAERIIQNSSGDG